MKKILVFTNTPHNHTPYTDWAKEANVELIWSVGGKKIQDMAVYQIPQNGRNFQNIKTKRSQYVQK